MRYSAQRYGTWEWLDLELPLDTDGPEWALSTYGEMYATIAPELGIRNAEDGRPVLEEWGTLIHAETGDIKTTRRWTGIVTRSELDGKDWELTIREFPGYLDETPIETTVWGVFADPASLFKKIVSDVQKRPTANLNIAVHGSTPLKVGTDSDDKAAAAKKIKDADKKVVDERNKTKKAATEDQQKLSKAQAKTVADRRKIITARQATVNELVKNKAPKPQIEAARQVVANLRAALEALQKTHKTALDQKKAVTKRATDAKEAADKKYEASNKAYDKAREKANEDGGAYKFLAEDIPDAFQSIGTLCEDTGIEWTTRTVYSETRPELHIDMHYPQAGGVRDDLVFEQGTNIISELKLVRDGEAYANASLGLGAGEGEKAIRATIESSSKRLRRVHTYTDRKVKKQSQLLAKMRKEMKNRTGQLYAKEIEVVDHPLAPIFSWRVGDHIRVSGEVPHHGFYSRMHRIISWQMVGDTRAILNLELST